MAVWMFVTFRAHPSAAPLKHQRADSHRLSRQFWPRRDASRATGSVRRDERVKFDFDANRLTNDDGSGREKKWKRNGKRMEKMEKAKLVFELKRRF